MTSRLYKEKKMKSSKKTPSIPQEIIFHVFSWLTVRALMRFRCISKYFNSLVSESYFMDIHQCHSKTRAKLLACEKDVFPYRDFFYTIEQNEDGKASLLHIEDYFDGLYNYICMNSNSVECVNGLFCFWSHARQPAAVICNPSTREKISLPYISNPFPSHYSLGFEPEKKIYKVLFTRTEYSRGSRSGIARNWILTLSIEESWNEIESIPRFFRLGRICINGVIYMLNGDDHKEYVIAFDLKDESFRTITLWKALHIYKRHYDLIEVKGNLAVLENTMINGEINMWILRKGQHEGWERHIIIGFPIVPKEMDGRMIHFSSEMHEKEIIFLPKVKDENFTYFRYDVTRKSWKKCEIQEFCQVHIFGGIYSWVESLFPLKKICHATKRKRGKRK